MKSRKFSRGFTLIELLVVIAIIGILTSVVLASLNSARTKGGDAGVKDNLSSVRTQVEVYYNDNNTYGTALTATSGSCVPGTGVFTDASVKAAVAQAVSNGGGAGWCAVTATPAAYAVAVPLKTQAVTGSTSFWCVDSTGVATTTTKATGTSPISAAAACI